MLNKADASGRKRNMVFIGLRLRPLTDSTFPLLLRRLGIQCISAGNALIVPGLVLRDRGCP